MRNKINNRLFTSTIYDLDSNFSFISVIGMNNNVFIRDTYEETKIKKKWNIILLEIG